MSKYIEFLDGLKPINPTLVEGIAQAYRVIFEESRGQETMAPERKPIMTMAEIRAARASAKQQAPTSRPVTPQAAPSPRTRGWENSGTDLNKWVLKIKDGGYPKQLVAMADELITTLATIMAHDKKINVKGKDGSVKQQSIRPVATEYHGKLENALKSVSDRADNESVQYLNKFLNSLKSATDAISADSFLSDMPDEYVDNGEYGEDEDDYDVSI